MRHIGNPYWYQRGLVLWQGPSTLDGQPIVAVATLESDNSKTGDCVQTWFLRQDSLPTSAARDGADVSVCGDCPHRIWNSCYVNLSQAPNQVWRSWQNGRYPVATRELLVRYLSGRVVRLGSYGDPACVPQRVIDDLCRYASHVIGYTHQWRRSDAAHLACFCMASVDFIDDARSAHHRGWRTFRAARADDNGEPITKSLGQREMCCPSKIGVSCIDCKGCDGTRSSRPNVVIGVHGPCSCYFKGD